MYLYIFWSDVFVSSKTYALNYHRDAVIAYLCTKYRGYFICVGRSVPYGNIPVPKDHLRIEVDVSGYMLKKISASQTEVIMLFQLRDIRKAGMIAFELLRKRRLTQVAKLKHYVESKSVHEWPKMVPSSAKEASKERSLRVELGRARTQAVRSRIGSNAVLNAQTMLNEVVTSKAPNRIAVEDLLKFQVCSLDELRDRAESEGNSPLLYLVEEMIVEHDFFEKQEQLNGNNVRKGGRSAALNSLQSSMDGSLNLNRNLSRTGSGNLIRGNVAQSTDLPKAIFKIGGPRKQESQKPNNNNDNNNNNNNNNNNDNNNNDDDNDDDDDDDVPKNKSEEEESDVEEESDSRGSYIV